MEWKTYLKFRSAVEYKGMARAGWVGDYMDPYTFLSQFYTPKNDSSTGYWDPKFDALLDKANNTKDPAKRENPQILENQPIRYQPASAKTDYELNTFVLYYCNQFYCNNPQTLFS